MQTIGTFKDEKGHERPLRISPDKLVKTRALITANSGGGKSYLLRVLLELLGLSTPIIVLDREGEYVTLGEKLDVVQVGPLGEIPADVRSAGMLCRRLMEKRLSSVIDMSDLPIDQQRAYVKVFLTELVSLKKSLWRPTFIALDEAHIFAPEKGHGDAESLEAVINAATLGRKRGYCTLFATQRISKLHKDAAADQNNRFFGRVTLDVDVQRSSKDLGMSDKDARTTLRELKPGEFYAFGPAIDAPGVVRMRTATAQTTHPEPGQGRTLKPPKPSKAIEAVLSELTDLPKEAEREIKDLATAKAKLVQLERELKARPKERVTQEKTVEVSSRRNRQMIVRLRAGLEEAMKVIANINAKGFESTTIDRKQIMKAMEAASDQIVKLVESKLGQRNVEFEKLKKEANALLGKLQKLMSQDVSVSLDVKHNEPFTIAEAKRAPAAPRPSRDAGARSELAGPERKVLDAIAFWESIGVADPNNTAVALKAGYSPGSSSYERPRGFLRTSGAIAFPKPDHLTLTEAGRAMAEFPESIGTLDELHDAMCSVLPGPETKLLRALIKVFPDTMTNAELSAATGYSEGSSSYERPRGKLRTIGLIEFRDGGIAATKVLFPDNLSIFEDMP